MQPIRSLVCALALLVASSGCMTLDTQLSNGYQGDYVYSGVRKDLEIMGPAFLHLSMGWVILTLIDLPLSFVADTLLLPVSIGRDAERSKQIAQRTQVETDRPALVHAHEGEAAVETARRLFEVCVKLLRRQDDEFTDCYGVDASVSLADGASLTGSAYKLAIRAALAQQRDEAISVDWREPAFEPEAARVRVRATRRSSREPTSSPITLELGPGADGGWRILAERSVGWPEK